MANVPDVADVAARHRPGVGGRTDTPRCSGRPPCRPSAPSPWSHGPYRAGSLAAAAVRFRGRARVARGSGGRGAGHRRMRTASPAAGEPVTVETPGTTMAGLARRAPVGGGVARAGGGPERHRDGERRRGGAGRPRAGRAGPHELAIGRRRARRAAGAGAGRGTRRRCATPWAWVRTRVPWCWQPRPPRPGYLPSSHERMSEPRNRIEELPARRASACAGSQPAEASAARSEGALLIDIRPQARAPARAWCRARCSSRATCWSGAATRPRRPTINASGSSGG